MVDIVLTAPDPQIPLVNPDGTGAAFFVQYLQQLTSLINANSIPLVGTGTPEGVLSALPLRWYIDTAAPVGEGIYFKETGTGDTGWVKRS